MRELFDTRFLVFLAFNAGSLFIIFRQHGRDLNGLGRKYWKKIACDLRCLAAEEPISKEKLLRLADCIDPK